MTVSPPVRIAAIVGLIAALALGVGFMLMGHGSATGSAPSHGATRDHPFGPGAKAGRPATRPPAKPAGPTGAGPAAKPAAPAVHKPTARPAAELAALAAGVPAKIARALGQSRVVVVEFSN